MVEIIRINDMFIVQFLKVIGVMYGLFFIYFKLLFFNSEPELIFIVDAKRFFFCIIMHGIPRNVIISMKCCLVSSLIR